MRMLFAALLLLVVPGPAAAQEDGIFPFDYRLVELENGFNAGFRARPRSVAELSATGNVARRYPW